MEPYKIYDFEDEKAWLKGRLNGIGGKDGNGVGGKKPNQKKIELFLEKTGRKNAPENSEKPYVVFREEGGAVIQGAVRPV